MSGFGDNANRAAHRRTEKGSEVVKIGLQAADVVLCLSAVLPSVRRVCNVARNVLRDVHRLHDRADDVIAAGGRVVDVLKTLHWIAENANTLRGLARERVEQRLLELEQLLNALHDAVRAFGRKGFLKTMFRKDAKTLKLLDRDIRDALDMLRVDLELRRDQKFEELLQNPKYALEEAIEKQIQGQTDMGVTLANAVESLENDEAAIEAIAVEGGVSDDVFLQELGEGRASIREHFLCFSHSFEDLHNDIDQIAMQQECAENLAQYYERAAITHADDSEHMKSILGRGTFGESHKMRYRLDGRDCAFKCMSIRGANRHSLLQSELRWEVVVLYKLQHEHIVAFYEVRLTMTPWLGMCLAIVMEFVAGGTLLDRTTSSLEVDLEAATKWLRQLASALAHVHRRIQHRDLKLDNVVVDHQGDVPPQRPVRM